MSWKSCLNRTVLAGECAIYQSVPLIALGMLAGHGRQVKLLTWAILFAPPLSALFILVALAGLLPGLMFSDRIAFPVNITFPLMFTAITLAMTMIWTSIGSTSVLPPELRPMSAWFEVNLLALTWFAQTGILTIVVLIRNRPKREMPISLP